MEIRFRVLLLTPLLLSGCSTLAGVFGHRPAQQAPAQDSGTQGGSQGDSSGSTGQAGSSSGSGPGSESAPPGTGSGSAAPDDQGGNPPPVIEPQVERRQVTVPHIRSRDFEVGGYLGTLNIEDFGAHEVYGVQIGYHLSEDFFLQAEAGRSEGGRTSFEVLSNINLLTQGERWFKYYDASLGYNFLPGEVYLGTNHAMVSSLYLLAGVGATEFGGDQNFTVNFGAGYKLLPTDWMAVHVAVEDRVFNSDILGVEKLASNLEAHIGLTFFF